MSRIPTIVVALALAVGATAGCGGYSMRLEEVRLDVQANRLVEAEERLEPLVLAGEAGERPEERDLPLLLLERAAIRQALQDHQGAVADLNEADAMLEVLDLSPDRAGEAATYLWSESRSLYRPPVYEKLMVNVMACSSYLAMDQRSSAMVEARRIGVLLDFFDDGPMRDHPMLGAAAYVAGLAMELGGDRSGALRFYLDAWRRSDAPGLARSVAWAAQGTRFATDPDVQRARAAIGLADDAPVPERSSEELVTIVFAGLAPYRQAERFPIGVVFAWMRANVAYELGADEATYHRIVAEGLLTWINFPVLVEQPNPFRQFDVQAGAHTARASRVADVEAFALRQWASDRAGIAWAAITRAITRVIAREAIQAAGRAAGGAGETIGFIAGLAAQGAMQAADTPDTRTWTFMPASVWVARQPVEAGPQAVRVTARGNGLSQTQTVDVDVPEGAVRVRVVRYFD